MKLIGAKVPRVEDRRILTGRGHYIDDLHLPKMLHAAFVRSPFPHARLTSVDASAAVAMPGVRAVLTGEDMKAACAPIKVMMSLGSRVPEFYPLATTKVRLVGDPVAMVVADSRAEAEDACDVVEVGYEPLPGVASAAAALAPGAPELFDDVPGNLVYTDSTTFGDVEGAFAEADRVLDVTLRQHRITNAPMETRGTVADYDAGSGQLTYHAATQGPHGLRLLMAEALEFPMERLRVLTGDVGGSFGQKSGVSREDLCLATASIRLGRPVKWTEDRNEHLLVAGHAREETISAQVAIKTDGSVLGIKASLVLDQGTYPSVPFSGAAFTQLMKLLLPGPYRVRGYSMDITVATTNKAEYITYRGPWEMETWFRERMLDVVAHELGLDPADVRRTNLLDGAPGDALITGLSVAGISSRESLERALELIDYQGFRQEQVAARIQGRHLGIGFATFIEPAPGPPQMWQGGRADGGEGVQVKLEADGHLVVVTAQGPHGQGHETTLAQVAADEMGVSLEQVRVVHGDTNVTPFSLIGTGGSRSATWAGGAVLASTRKLKEKVLAIAAGLLEIGPEDLEIDGGVVAPKGVPGRGIRLAEIATQALLAPKTLPPGTDRFLEVREAFQGDGITGSGWSGGTHACTVELEPQTGAVRILRWVVVEDCGRVINPAIVEGQVRGGVAQGIGEVLYEHAAYDRDGNFLAGTFMDYLLPSAHEIPDIEIEHLETDPDGEFGFRGVGEGGAVVAPATLTNAIADALRPFGAHVREQHLPPSRILELTGALD